MSRLKGGTAYDPSRSEVNATIEPRSLAVKAAGELSVAGQSRPVTLALTATPDGPLTEP